MRFYNVLGLDPSVTYEARRYDVQRFVAFTPAFARTPQAWGIGGDGLEGYSADNPNFGIGWCEVVPNTVGANGCMMRTYVYEVWQNGAWIRYPDYVSFSGGVYGVQYVARALEIAGQPDIGQSFYVPQRGSVGTPIEGTTAMHSFFMCPNNDMLSGLNCRIKVVAKDLAGSGIPGIQTGDIFILLNGGTPAQGFVGDGADSVIANSTYNQNPHCPDLRAIEADAPTDAAGVTYITFVGSTPGNPGVGLRNPARKWGHYDTEFPVYILGQKISGRLTSSSPNGSYSLQIKNCDLSEQGLRTVMDDGEAVTENDVNYMAAHNGLQGKPYSWWADLNSDASVNVSDFNVMTAHMNHDCEYPNNP